MKPSTSDFRGNHARPFPGSIVVGVLACLLFGGCGESADSLTRAPVSGTIFVSGRPLASGVVRFVPTGETEGPVTIATVNEGCFSLTDENGPVVGTYRVEIAATNFLGFDPGNQEAAEQAMRAARAGEKPLPRNPVPLRYRRDSPLMAEIPPQGINTLDFVIGAGRSKS